MPKKLTLAEFVAKAQAVHGLGKYDYTDTVYLPIPQKITIKCPEHGAFMQPAAAHVFGKGCPDCGQIIQRAKVRALGHANAKWDTASVRVKATELHPSLDFSKFEYLGNGIESTVICPTHGEFLKSPHYVLAGRGCWDCQHVVGCKKYSWVGAQRGRTATLYIIQCESNGELFYKVGITLNTIERRFHNTRDMPYQYSVLVKVESEDAAAIYDLEKAIHRKLKPLKYRPTLPFGGQHECFSSLGEVFPL